MSSDPVGDMLIVFAAVLVCSGFVVLWVLCPTEVAGYVTFLVVILATVFVADALA